MMEKAKKEAFRLRSRRRRNFHEWHAKKILI